VNYPIAVDAGFSRSSGFWARRIMSADGSWWCHAFIRFRFNTGGSRIFESRIQTHGFAETDPTYYDLEALKDVGKETDVQAVQLIELCAAYPVTGRFASFNLINDALERCKQWDGVASYPVSQLAAIWLAKRYGIPVPRSEHKLICSEALAVIAFELGVDLRDKWHPNFDSVTPGSAWNNLMAIHAGHGDQIMRNKEVNVCGTGFSKYYSLRRPPRS
jgi:hypothetical protein